MSRYNMTPKDPDLSIIVGWDNPLATFGDELMEGERVVYTYEDPRSHNQVRIILRGEFNKKLLDAIAFYVNSEIEDQKSMPKPDSEITASTTKRTSSACLHPTVP